MLLTCHSCFYPSMPTFVPSYAPFFLYLERLFSFYSLEPCHTGGDTRGLRGKMERWSRPEWSLSLTFSAVHLSSLTPATWQPLPRVRRWSSTIHIALCQCRFMYPVTKGKSNEKIQGAIFYAPSLPLPAEGGGAAAWTIRGTPAVLFPHHSPTPHCQSNSHLQSERG